GNLSFLVSHFGIRAISNFRDFAMVETRYQEKTMIELIEEIHTSQERQPTKFCQRADYLYERYNKHERLFNDAGGSQMIDPTSAESNRPPNPPDLQGRFNGLFDDPLAYLVSLKHGSDTIEEFLEKFENARTRLSLHEAHALSIFLTNMNPHLSLHVHQFGVITLSPAARIAIFHKSSLATTAQRSHRASFNPSQQHK
ncbi:hypothetical protein IGI04_014978, partial [Brassica rapa subsp. trilocularis]